jgi:hypothetical protein
MKLKMSPHVVPPPPKQRNRQNFLNTVCYQEYQTMAGFQKQQINLQNTTQLKKSGSNYIHGIFSK